MKLNVHHQITNNRSRQPDEDFRITKVAQKIVWQKGSDSNLEISNPKDFYSNQHVSPLESV